MGSGSGTSWASGDRRQTERRVSERRHRAVAVTADHRKGRDRRTRIRRSGEDRRQRQSREHALTNRRLTPLPYSREEAIPIRERIVTSGEPGICPVCSGTFAVGPPIPRSGRTVREYRCRDCRRALMVSVSG